MKTAFLFSGQGAQYSGMAKEFFDISPKVKTIFKSAEESLQRDVAKMCFSGTQEELNLTHNTQVCMLAADLASAAVLMEHGIRADAMAGFSLGEYAAMVCSGVLQAKDAFRVVQIRADAMQKAVPVGEGAMAALMGVKAEIVENLCKKIDDDYVVPANYNSPIQTVVSGTKSGVEKIMNMAKEQGIMCVELAVSAPFHCKLMAPAAEAIKDEFSNIPFSVPQYPVYMNIDASIPKDVNDISEKLYLQAMNPVRWRQTLQNMNEVGIDTYIECGPGKVLSGFVRKTLKNVTICHVEDVKTLEETLKKLGHSV